MSSPRSPVRNQPPVSWVDWSDVTMSLGDVQYAPMTPGPSPTVPYGSGAPSAAPPPSFSFCSSCSRAYMRSYRKPHGVTPRAGMVLGDGPPGVHSVME